MIIRFQIHYSTHWGQILCICGSLPELGNSDPDNAAKMSYLSDGLWEFTLDVQDDQPTEFGYKYLILHEQNHVNEWEGGDQRCFNRFPSSSAEMQLRDAWRPPRDIENVMYTSAFTKVLLRRPETGKSAKSETNPLTGSNLCRFQMHAPRVGPNHLLCVLGSDPSLGSWDSSKAVLMSDEHYPLWRTDIALKATEGNIQYKYAIYDKIKKTISTWEEGQDRSLWLDPDTSDSAIVITDEKFKYPAGHWKGAGVAIPVSGIRTSQGLGVGEFLDLIPLVDWACATGLKLIQVLPVNDTVANHTATDSSPYSAISVFALHPLYLNLDAIAAEDPEIKKEITELRKKLNALEKIDYVKVMDFKFSITRKLFLKQKENFLSNPEFKTFLAENESWLRPYAAFVYLRDLYGTINFGRWKTHQKYDAAEIEAFTRQDSPHFDEIALHYFIQFHLHCQLLKAADYARDKGVVLKGDIPIGVRGQSLDSWATPEQFNMLGQAGAPPDDFSLIGQNWGFPTYNWEHMALDNYAWWQSRLIKMASYFDAYRIDHILGFFRIWEMPDHSVQGLLGHFSPCLPMSKKEIERWGLKFDYERFCRPYIRRHMLEEIFAERAEEVMAKFLVEYKQDQFQMASGFETQKQILLYFIGDPDCPRRLSPAEESLLNGLYSLVGEVLFLVAPNSSDHAFNPRISLHSTWSYRELPDQEKGIIHELYIDYFYKRHEQFWADQGRIRLPVIRNATNMLVCGEDLGMVPDSVPGVMDEDSILGLSIESMPKKPTERFANPAHTPYLCVCSTSCHDMAPLRSWWEQDRDVTQLYFNTMLHQDGAAPYFCEPWIVREVILRHLYSPSMWAIFPIQDILAMSSELRIEDPHAEQINIPGKEHHWNYRMHISLEELLIQNKFNNQVKELMDQTGRNSDY